MHVAWKLGPSCHIRVAGKGVVTARIALLLPGEPFLGGPPASRLCSTVADICEQLDTAIRMKVSALTCSLTNGLPRAS